MGKSIFNLILLLTFITYNVNASQGENEKSCMELRKYNVSSTKIDLKNKELKEINCISKYRNVQELDLRWNKIKDLSPLSGLSGLKVLKINFNQIENISPLLNLLNLRELWIHNNRIRNIRGIGILSKLEHLDVSFNPLKEGVEELGRLPKLKRLELREVPEGIVDYVYENYRKFIKLEKIFIEERMDESRKKLGNEEEYPEFSKFYGNIDSFEMIKNIGEISTETISEENLPKEIYRIVNKYNRNAETEEEKITGISYFRKGDYSVYVIGYPYAYAGKSNSEIYFMKKDRVIATDIADIYAQLESIRGDDLFLSYTVGPGESDYILADLENEIIWTDGHRDYKYEGEIKKGKIYRTGKIFRTVSKENEVNVREEPDSKSPIMYKLKNGMEVEEIFEENNWKYVYLYNGSGYYMKGYIHRSQLEKIGGN